MTDLLSVWEPIIFIFSKNFLHIGLLVNVILTFLVLQNIRNRRSDPDRSVLSVENIAVPEKEKIPPFYENFSDGSRKPSVPDIDLSKIERVIKMIRDGYSQQEIKKVVDIEAAYLSILQNNYNLKQR